MRAMIIMSLVLLPTAAGVQGKTVRLDSRWMTVDVETPGGRWALTDKRSGVRWPSKGTAAGAGFAFKIVDEGRSLEIRREKPGGQAVRWLGDALGITDTEGGYVVVPCREGLLVGADSGREFRRTFGTSDYEGCHMNVLGFVKAGSAMLVTWDDAYVFPTLASTRPKGQAYHQLLTADFSLRRSARSLRLTPLGKGDWNTLAAGYRRIAEQKRLAVTLREKIRRNATAERMIGAANVKLWTCLARRMNEASTKEESVRVRWTFDEAARIAEHLRGDLGLRRCLFMMGGWTEGGYDCRHPDNLPANPECGGNKGLADAVGRIQKLKFVACLHDNYQDMYRDAKSWDPKLIEKRADGSLIKGGRWLGGRAYMVCSPKQLELAKRPQNLPGIRKLFPVASYFIDTTFAVGPRECHDPNHPIGRNDDIQWKIRLSDYARQVFGLFGSECGREWALPHSDFFEGLVGVSGRYYHNLDPARLGATPIPFWEMVYHDCQICYGKYGYAAGQAAEYVAHHVLCARPLHYHSIGDHLYWKSTAVKGGPVDVRPRVVSVEPTGQRAFKIRYAWDVRQDVAADWRIFVHFGTSNKIRFQDDHAPQPPTSKWRKPQRVGLGPHTVHVPPTVRDEIVDVYIGLFSTTDITNRAALPGCDSQRRILAGRLRLRPQIRFEMAPHPKAAPDRACYTRCDGGWAEGLHPTDVFIKNTQELLGPLHTATAHSRLERLEFLTPNRTVRRATYGRGGDATTVVVNFGLADAEVDSALGGRALLGPWGFVVDGPQFAAFHAKRWAGQDYAAGAMFTLRALDAKPLTRSARVRIFHAFGSQTIQWLGARHRVRRETVVEPTR